jgi:hypothetical protein
MRTKLWIAVLLAIATVAVARSSAQSTSALPRVYVTTAPSGAVEELRDRQQSVKDLRKALAGKKKVLTLVDVEEKAEITVEVIGRSTTVPRVRFGLPTPGQVGPARVARLRVKATRGETDPISFTNENSPLEANRGWESAAEDIAKQIEKWISGKKVD